jgi:hypothetical protein
MIGAVLNELLDKSIHAICMVHSNRAGTQSCVGQPIAENTRINLVHIIRTMPGQDTYLNPLQDELRQKLNPYLAIFAVSGVVVLSYDLARTNGALGWIV